jgi:Cu/Ag efflux protein CusF
MRMILITVAASLALTPAAARAQTKAVTHGEAIELTATVEAIDHDARLITLKDKDGNVETLEAGPEIKRFNELKVGDTVTFRYHQAMVLKIRKPGEAAAPSADKGLTVTREKGPKPGGTASHEITLTVTVQAIDPETPSLTVLTDTGRVASFKVQDKNNIKGLAVGDRVEITYTEAVAISVK